MTVNLALCPAVLLKYANRNVVYMNEHTTIITVNIVVKNVVLVKQAYTTRMSRTAKPGEVIETYISNDDNNDTTSHQDKPWYTH